MDNKIGQMFITGFKGTVLNSAHHIITDIKEKHLGGVLLYDHDDFSKSQVQNIESKQQLKQLISQLQEIDTSPLFIAIDQEGGEVSRLKEKYGFPNSVSAQYLGNRNDPEVTRYWSSLTASTLHDLGINLNFAPVVDVNVNAENPIIAKYKRSFSDDTEIIVKHAGIFIDEHRKKNILCCLKHFPGHGSSKQDSHLGFTDVTETWSEVELEPYERLIEQNRCDMIMTAHVFNKNLDSNFPATLSHNVITGILRNKLKFDGIIISDDLRMKAITDYFGFDIALKKTINAGVDMIILSNNTILSEAIEIVKNLVRTGQISESRINDAYQKIKKYKSR